MSKHLCTAKEAGILDNWYRRIAHKPSKILLGFVKKGMTVIDLGCGSGYFIPEMARLVGIKGRVVGADLQKEMLKLTKERMKGTGYEKRIKLHKCGKKIGFKGKVDLAFVFYVLHEVDSPSAYLKELKTMLKKKGRVLLVEPKFHVTKKEFLKEVEMAKKVGFSVKNGPKIMVSRAVVLTL